MSKRSSSEVSPLDAHLGFWLRFVSNQVSARFQALLAEHDISVTEWVAMRELFEHSDASHADLIRALGMTKGAASKVVAKLESKGLVARELAKDKAREQVLALTARGKRLLPKLASCADENDQYFFGHLVERQRSELMALMKDLVRHHQFKEVPIS